jgi:hypothetical protein
MNQSNLCWPRLQNKKYHLNIFKNSSLFCCVFQWLKLKVRYQFISLCDPKQLSEYMIIEVEIVQDKDKPQRIPVSNKV